MERKEKMKKKKSVPRLFLVMISACLLLTVGMTACSSDEDEFSKTNPQELIIGKWKQVRQGNIDTTDSNTTLDFRSDGKVVYAYDFYDENGKTNHSERESAYTFEDDWYYDEVQNTPIGHLSFLMHEELGTNVPDRFLVWFEENQLVLLPHMGNYYLLDPTMYFERIK